MALFFTKLSESLLVNLSEATKYVEQTIWQVAFQNVQERKGWEEFIENSAKGIACLPCQGEQAAPATSCLESYCRQREVTMGRNLEKAIR